MENGRITLTKSKKAKIQANFATLMAMNPRFEKFNRDLGLVEQIRLPPSTLSRFDVIFTMFDEIKDENEEIEILRTMLEDEEELERNVNKEGLIKYLLYAQTLKPKIPKEIKEKIVKYAYGLRKKGLNRRVTKSLKKLVIK